MSNAVISWVYNFIGDRRASMLVDGVFTECQVRETLCGNSQTAVS